MYNPEVNMTWLYPGDIFIDIPIPNLKNEPFKLIAHNDEHFSVRRLLSGNIGIYLSHECDFNSGKRNFLLIAPLQNIPGNIIRDPGELQKISSSNDIERSPHYLNYFFLGQSNPILENPMIVDFTRMIHVPISMREELLHAKRLQLSEENKKLLKIKIAHYFVHE